MSAAEVAFGLPSPTAANRHLGLGGSDLPAVLGLSRWRSKLDVYLEKIGEAPPQEDTVAMFRGRLFEAAIIEEYERIMGIKTTMPMAPFVHPTCPYLRGNVDRIVTPTRIAEVKCTRHRDSWGEPGTNQIPEDHTIQSMTYLALEERWEVCDVVVCVVSEMVDHVIKSNICDLAYLQRFARDVVRATGISIYPVLKDRVLCDFLVETANQFWTQHVLPRVPPLPSTLAEAQRAYRAISGKVLAVNADFVANLKKYAAMGRDIKALEADRERLQLDLVLEMGEASTATYGDKVVATWNESKRQALSYQRFRDEQPEMFARYSEEKRERRFLAKVQP